MTQERIFLTHPDGSEEIYNLQVVKESELPGFFSQFKLETDDGWKDVARRWLFFNATHLSQERVEEIVEKHNEEHELELMRDHFHGYTQIVHPFRGQQNGKEYAVYNLDRSCFLGELGGFTERQTFTSKRNVAEFLLDQVHNHGHLQESNLDHLEVVSINSETDITEKALKAAKQYSKRVDEDKPNGVIAEKVLADCFDEIEQETEVVE